MYTTWAQLELLHSGLQVAYSDVTISVIFSREISSPGLTNKAVLDQLWSQVYRARMGIVVATARRIPIKSSQKCPVTGRYRTS